MNKYIENVKCPLCDGKKIFVKSSNLEGKHDTTCWHECENCGPTDPINSEKEKIINARAIVFRAWDMSEDEGENTGVMREVDVELDGYVHAWIEDEDGNEERYMIGAVSPNRILKQIPIMQYLGIMDKNDNPIFEGDIVITDEAGWKAKVIFDTDMYYCIDNKGGFATECNWEKYEIIGNIYENPDILEK